MVSDNVESPQKINKTTGGHKKPKTHGPVKVPVEQEVTE